MKINCRYQQMIQRYHAYKDLIKWMMNRPKVPIYIDNKSRIAIPDNIDKFPIIGTER